MSVSEAEMHHQFHQMIGLVAKLSIQSEPLHSTCAYAAAELLIIVQIGLIQHISDSE